MVSHIARVFSKDHYFLSMVDSGMETSTAAHVVHDIVHILLAACYIMSFGFCLQHITVVSSARHCSGSPPLAMPLPL